jgi:hypothetical protein
MSRDRVLKRWEPAKRGNVLNELIEDLEAAETREQEARGKRKERAHSAPPSKRNKGFKKKQDDKSRDGGKQRRHLADVSDTAPDVHAR